MQHVEKMHVGEVISGITLKVTGWREFRVRWWIAAKVMIVAGWIAGTKLEIEAVA